MNGSYIQALETKARWSKWIEGEGQMTVPPKARAVLPAYEHVLHTPDTHFMNAKFCDLVDHARKTVPDDLRFEMPWAHSKWGWLWLETPFECPRFLVSDEVAENARKIWNREMPNAPFEPVADMPAEMKKLRVKIRAVGWMPVGKISTLSDGRRYGATGEGGGTAFLLFHELGKDGFGMWSYFTLMDGDKVIDRIRAFEATATKEGGAYQKDRETNELHEIRWIYTAFYLMAQKLAVEVRVPTDRATKRRAEREGRTVPDTIKVVSLRRLEAARLKTQQTEKEPVEWHWQWEVRGHWRNQYYRAANEHRPVFVEAYIKGPEDKPLKNPGQKLFAAVR